MKQKLLFLYGPLNPGGAERVLLDFLSHLDRGKYEIDLCLMVGGGQLRSEVPEDVRVFHLWDAYDWHYKLAHRLSAKLGLDFLFKRRLRNRIVKDYDVVISFLEGMPMKLHGLMGNPTKNITWVHIDLNDFRYTEKLFFRNKEKEAFEKMDVVVCVSNDTKNAFQKRFKDFSKPVKVIYNPIDSEKIQRLAGESSLVPEEEFKVIIVGRLTEQKRVDRLIQVAAKCKEAGLKIRFQIVGDGGLRGELEEMVKDLGVEDVMEFLGYQANPYPYIKAADVLISTSAFEGFGLVLCEAMVLDVPVISTKTAGPVEILDGSRYGFLCGHEVEAIFEAVKRMYEDEGLRREYVIKGRERAKDFEVRRAMEAFNGLMERR